MGGRFSRREWLAGVCGAASALAARPKGILVDTHIHLFSADPGRFPYHPNAPYRPPPQPLENYVKFVNESKIDHSVIVHPEPYQDDHRYLEYCLQHEPRPGFFKGTCLFDPIAPDTPKRMEALVGKHKGRIVALRIHVNRIADKPPTTSGAIRDRDLRSGEMRQTWRAAHSLGLAIQMHFIPVHAPQIGALAGRFPDTPVILDHIARSGQGTPEEFDNVLRLAKHPRVYMKFSGLQYSSKRDYPHPDVKPKMRQVWDAFGPDRILWGGLGMNMAEFEKRVALFESIFDFAPESERAKVRGLNAIRLFRF